MPSSLNLIQLLMKQGQKLFPFYSKTLRTQGQGVSIYMYTVALLCPCMCVGKFGLGGDALGDFTRLGVSPFLRAGQWVKHVDFIIFELNDNIVKQSSSSESINSGFASTVLFGEI